VRGASIGHHVAEGVLAVVSQATARLSGHFTYGPGIDAPFYQLIDIREQQFDAVGIDSAEVGGHKRIADQFRHIRGDVVPHKQSGTEVAERL
jgi:hypothetical protein